MFFTCFSSAWLTVLMLSVCTAIAMGLDYIPYHSVSTVYWPCAINS